MYNHTHQILFAFKNKVIKNITYKLTLLRIKPNVYYINIYIIFITNN